MKNIYLLVGESGSGKTTVATALEKSKGYISLQSYTTRPRRTPDETGHTFITEQEFAKLTDIIGYTEFDSHKYCATARQIDMSDIYVIDEDGVNTVKTNYKGNKGIKTIFINSSMSTRYERMKQRGIDNGMSYLTAVDSALMRITHDLKKFKDIKNTADFVVENNMNTTISEVVSKVQRFILECENEEGDS